MVRYLSCSRGLGCQLSQTKLNYQLSAHDILEMMKGSINSCTRTQSAFTIVELLVVIVVIAILAAITIVSYTGITSRATASALQSDLDNASKQLKLYETDHGSFPTSIDGSYCPIPDDTKYCLKTSNGNTFIYSSASSSTFKLIATKDSSTSYYITENLAPTIGGNLLTDENASFESGTVVGWTWINGGTVANSTSWSAHGARALGFSYDGNLNGNPFAGLNVNAITSAGSQYTFQAKVDNAYSGIRTFRVFLYDNVSSFQFGSSVVVPAGGTATITSSATYGVGSTTRAAGVQLVGIGLTTGVCYIDAAKLESGSVATPF